MPERFAISRIRYCTCFYICVFLQLYFLSQPSVVCSLLFVVYGTYFYLRCVFLLFYLLSYHSSLLFALCYRISPYCMRYMFFVVFLLQFYLLSYDAVCCLLFFLLFLVHDTCVCRCVFVTILFIIILRM